MVVLSRRDFSGLETSSIGVMSPTIASAISWTRAMEVQRGMSSFERREGGARRVSMDMRYMWSAIDSPPGGGVSG